MNLFACCKINPNQGHKQKNCQRHQLADTSLKKGHIARSSNLSYICILLSCSVHKREKSESAVLAAHTQKPLSQCWAVFTGNREHSGPLLFFSALLLLSVTQSSRTFVLAAGARTDWRLSISFQSSLHWYSFVFLLDASANELFGFRWRASLSDTTECTFDREPQGLRTSEQLNTLLNHRLW